MIFNFQATMLRAVVLLFLITNFCVDSCLITNCPRGGKRGGKPGISDGNVKSCIPCGPGNSGKCFGPNICCGRFGCLMGTPETIRCQKEGMFHEREPCIAGNASCRRNTGRCATENICCSQDSCFMDRQCSSEEKLSPFTGNLMDLYNLINYPSEISIEK